MSNNSFETDDVIVKNMLGILYNHTQQQLHIFCEYSYVLIWLGAHWFSSSLLTLSWWFPPSNYW